MSYDAVALVRIPEWEPAEELDVRELDDAVLVFLDVPFDADHDQILDDLEEKIGDAMYGNEDDRGIFILPDAAEPEDVETYDGVIETVGAAGMFIPLDLAPMPDGADAETLLANPESLLGQLFEAMGAGNAQDAMRAMREGDQDALKLMQIQMSGALERALQGSMPPEEPQPPKPEEGDGKKR